MAHDASSDPDPAPAPAHDPGAANPPGPAANPLGPGAGTPPGPSGTPPDDGRVDGVAAVVEWGNDDAPSERRRSRLLARLRHDRRIVPIIAGLGGLAVLGSVLSEWRVWTFEEPGGPTQQVSTGVVGFASVGTAYLIGILVLVASLVLTFFGTGATRQHARLVGLAAAIVLGVVLIAATVNMKHVGGLMDDFFFGLGGPANEATMAYGRGLYLAYAGVGALAVALWLAAPLGQRAPWQQAAWQPAAWPQPGWPPAEEPTPPPTEHRLDLEDEDELGPDWPWRPRYQAPRSESPRRAVPLDLTVEPAAPFVGPTDDHEAR
jgi:hypothetical protein